MTYDDYNLRVSDYKGSLWKLAVMRLLHEHDVFDEDVFQQVENIVTDSAGSRPRSEFIGSMIQDALIEFRIEARKLLELQKQRQKDA